jgi:hypothetical protein
LNVRLSYTLDALEKAKLERGWRSRDGAGNSGINILAHQAVIWNFEIAGLQISDPKSEVSDRKG